MKAAPPMAAEAGEMPDKAGTGFAPTLIVTALDVTGPGLLTVMESVPTEVRLAAGIVTYRKLGFQLLGLSVVPLA